MPGTIPATSQLDRLISMTAINVLAGSRAMRDRLKLFTVCMGSSIGSQRAMDAISTPPPHSISHLGCMTAIACRIRSSACDTRAWLWVQYVLCWCAFPLAPALRSTDSAALAPADASAVGFLRFVRRLHCYYDEVRLLGSVHHRLRLLAFPMRTAVHTRHATTAARHEISQVPVRSLCT